MLSVLVESASVEANACVEADALLRTAEEQLGCPRPHADYPMPAEMQAEDRTHAIGMPVLATHPRDAKQQQYEEEEGIPNVAAGSEVAVDAGAGTRSATPVAMVEDMVEEAVEEAEEVMGVCSTEGSARLDGCCGRAL